MKISINWLKELVELTISYKELVQLLNLHTISTKDVTSDYIELDMKGYNRADLLSLRGVALEVAAISNSKVNFTEGDEKEYIWFGKKLPKVKVEVQDNKLCPLYCVAEIEGLKVTLSPAEWIKKLQDCGFRSVNNIADVTNLIMLEYGQPLHAFDANKVAGEKIIVRSANQGEKLTTLDGKDRQLTKTDLLITDDKKPLGLAGVMGGKDCEVSASTNAILLEAAIFDGKNLRRTAQRLGIQSEASKRFQHGLTKTRLLQALDAAIKMYQDLGGKLTTLTIVGNTTDKMIQITLTQNKINSLIGMPVSQKQIEASLTRLGFKLASQGDVLRGWNVEVPYWRLDIEIEEDVIEEIIRIYGYEKIPATSLDGKLPEKIDQSLFGNIKKIKQQLVDLGFTEVQTYSFYSTDVLKNTGKEKYLDYFIKVANPISSETEYLRCDIWPNLVEVVAKNIKHGFNDIAIFELGKVYLLNQDKSIAEDYRLGIALVNASDNPVAELNQIISQLSKELNLNISLGSSKQDQYAKDYFHPIRFSFLEKNGKIAGGIAEVHPRVVNRFGTDKRIAILECDIIIK